MRFTLITRYIDEGFTAIIARICCLSSNIEYGKDLDGQVRADTALKLNDMIQRRYSLKVISFNIVRDERPCPRVLELLNVGLRRPVRLRSHG